MRRLATAQTLAFILLTVTQALTQSNLTATEAKEHIGEQATVCGKVVSSRFAEGSRGRPTFLNFDQPYPNQLFTVVIWGNDRSKFGDPETAYRGKRVCATGKITEFKGIPEVAVQEPAQLKTQ